MDFSGVIFDDFPFFFSVFEEIFFEVFAESFVEVLLLLTLVFDSFTAFTADFVVEFLDKVVLRGALEATFVVFFAETSLLDLADFTLAFVLFGVTLADLEEDFELVAFLEA